MKPKLIWRIGASLIGAMVGMVLFSLILAAVSTASNTHDFQDYIATMFAHIVSDYVFGLVIITIINIIDTWSDKPRTYWFFVSQNGQALSIKACLVYGFFAPFFIFAIVCMYVFDVKNRKTNY